MGMEWREGREGRLVGQVIMKWLHGDCPCVHSGDALCSRDAALWLPGLSSSVTGTGDVATVSKV